jgi:hypothetical protein
MCGAYIYLYFTLGNLRTKFHRLRESMNGASNVEELMVVVDHRSRKEQVRTMENSLSSGQNRPFTSRCFPQNSFVLESHVWMVDIMPVSYPALRPQLTPKPEPPLLVI